MKTFGESVSHSAFFAEGTEGGGSRNGFKGFDAQGGRLGGAASDIGKTLSFGSEAREASRLPLEEVVVDAVSGLNSSQSEWSSRAFPWDATVERVNRCVFRNVNFRPMQVWHCHWDREVE